MTYIVVCTKSIWDSPSPSNTKPILVGIFTDVHFQPLPKSSSSTILSPSSTVLSSCSTILSPSSTVLSSSGKFSDDLDPSPGCLELSLLELIASVFLRLFCSTNVI
eukprot:XP_765661.1 hypothetical protein [Theileria parva strain Muguga]